MAAVGIATTASASKAKSAGFSLGIFEAAALNPASPGDAALVFARISDAGARYVRASVNWRDIAPAGAVKPVGFNARNPADPHYTWATLDAFVRGSASRGLAPVVTTLVAPRWAEGKGAPGTDGAFRPDPKAYGDFAVALARRYSGSFPDPAVPGKPLPRVRYFQAWNEPNFNRYLTPLKVGTRVDGPSMYVDLLNAFYTGIKSVKASNKVLSAGMGPFGYNGGATDMDPQVFIRDVLCLKGTAKRQTAKRPCGHERAKFDIWAQHPYTLQGTPASKGLSKDAGAIGNVPEIKRTLDRAVQLSTLGTRGAKPLWVTEIDWMTNPPGLNTSAGQLGKPPAVQARYLSEAAYRLWRTGVSAMIWYQLRDAGRIEDAGAWPGGLYFQGATLAEDAPKPSLQAFAMPFYAKLAAKGVYAWALVDRGGKTKVRVERLSGGTWIKAGDLVSGQHGLAAGTLRTRRKGKYRARALSGKRAGLISYTFIVK